MADAGEKAELVDSGNVMLTNATNSLDFKQMYNVEVNIEADVTKRQLTNSVLEKLFDLRDFTIDADIRLTEPESILFIGYTDQTKNLPIAKSWTVTYTGDDTNATTQTGTFRLSSLKFITPEEGYAWYHIRLESVEGAVASA